MEQETKIKKDSSPKYLVFGLVLSGLIFLIDAQIPLGIADGMLYVVLVLLTTYTLLQLPVTKIYFNKGLIGELGPCPRE